MANPVCEVLVTEAELYLPAKSRDLSAGAIVDFSGVVRHLEDGREIVGIEYEAHRPMAEHQLKLLAQQATEKFALKLIIVHHRLGLVPVGEASLLARVSSENRNEAFRAAQWLIDELKDRVPIWKRPKFKTDNHPVEKLVSNRKPHLISRG